jgi:predicted amidophosphoribosyltransferase
MPLAPVVVVADYRTGDHLHRRLRGYKDATAPEARRAHAVALAAVLEPWMAANRESLRRRFGSGWDLVVPVPSTHRPVGAPVDALISLVPELALRHCALLARGPEPTGHLRAGRRGFVLASGTDRTWLKHRRILVFDDTITTGARAQSSVAALRIAGARVVGVVAVGRALGAVDLRLPATIGLAVG